MSERGRVVVTGAGGYVGSALALHLVREGWRVVGFGHGRLFPALRERGGEALELIEGDLADASALGRAFAGADAVVHAASFAGERACRRDIPGALRAIVRGTRLVVDAAGAAAVRELVHLSTYAVYSTFRERPMPLREDDELLPDDLYGALKAEAEWEASRLPAAILRLTNVFGRGSGLVLKTDVFGHFTRAVREGRPLKLHAGGRQKIEFVHVGDVCAVVGGLLAGPRREKPLVLNVGAGYATPIRELAAIFQRVAREDLGREVEIVGEEGPADKLWPDRWVAIDRLRERFPWYPARTLEQGVRELLAEPPQT